MSKEKLKPIQKEILKVLVEHDYFLSTTEIADKAKVSWNTAINHLNAFHRKGWVEKRTASETEVDTKGRKMVLWKGIFEEDSDAV